MKWFRVFGQAYKLGPRLWRIGKAELMEHLGVRV